MSLIKNLVKEPNKDSPKKRDESDEDPKKEEQKIRPIIKSATDLQRLKLEKLMKDPQKPVVIAESRREKDYMASVPSFVRNVMGSSAGAGSGEFHVYRHLRRKEYARQKIIQAKSAREEADDAYREKLEENKRIAEEKTAKKRAKRLKKKQRAKKPRAAQETEQKLDVSATSDSNCDENDDVHGDEDNQANKSNELNDKVTTTVEIENTTSSENPLNNLIVDDQIRDSQTPELRRSTDNNDN